MALAELIPESDYTATMKPVRQATHAPGHIYSDSEIYALEKEKIFLKDWLAIARVEELENPGDFMTFRIVRRADRRHPRQRRLTQRLRQCLQAPRRRGRDR